MGYLVFYFHQISNKVDKSYFLYMYIIWTIFPSQQKGRTFRKKESDNASLFDPNLSPCCNIELSSV